MPTDKPIVKPSIDYLLFVIGLKLDNSIVIFYLYTQSENIDVSPSINLLSQFLV